jgi:hypothetical protein
MDEFISVSFLRITCKELQLSKGFEAFGQFMLIKIV